MNSEKNFTIPNLSVLVNGNKDDLHRANEKFREELQDSKALEESSAYIQKKIMEEYPNLKFHEAWNNYKKGHNIE